MTDIDLKSILEVATADTIIAVKQLPSKKDLPPTLIVIKDGMVVESKHNDILNSMFEFNKGVAFAVMRQALQEFQADAYVLILASWFTITENPTQEDIARIKNEGIANNPNKMECYAIEAGNSEECLFKLMKVKRDYKGKITELVEYTLPPDMEISGRAFNLMESPKGRTVN